MKSTKDMVISMGGGGGGGGGGYSLVSNNDQAHCQIYLTPYQSEATTNINHSIMSKSTYCNSALIENPKKKKK